jgi:hypothetical protein
MPLDIHIVREKMEGSIIKSRASKVFLSLIAVLIISEIAS